MPTVIINGKLEKSYDHWVSAFDGHDDVRKASGLKVLYRGHDLSDASAIHIVLQTPSMEVLGEFMKENAEYMKESATYPTQVSALIVVTCAQVLSSRPMQMVACSYKRIEAISTSQLRKDLCGSFVSKLCRKKRLE